MEEDRVLEKIAVTIMLVGAAATLNYQFSFEECSALQLLLPVSVGLMAMPPAPSKSYIHRASSGPLLDKIVALAAIVLCEGAMYYALPFNKFTAATAVTFGAAILSPAFPEQDR